MFEEPKYQVQCSLLAGMNKIKPCSRCPLRRWGCSEGRLEGLLKVRRFTDGEGFRAFRCSPIQQTTQTRYVQMSIVVHEWCANDLQRILTVSVFHFRNLRHSADALPLPTEVLMLCYLCHPRRPSGLLVVGNHVHLSVNAEIVSSINQNLFSFFHNGKRENVSSKIQPGADEFNGASRVWAEKNIFCAQNTDETATRL